MASTNKTSNYNLSQYVGTDKPTYLGDYNSDMNKIDAQMKANADDILENTQNINVVSETANTALENASTADGKAVEAGNTADNALAKALANETNINKFNLTIISRVGATSITGGSGATGQLTIAKNSDGSICKIYGTIQATGDGTSNDITIVTEDTGLRPESEIAISGCGFTGDLIQNFIERPLTYIIQTDGKIRFNLPKLGRNSSVKSCNLTASLVFVKDFGD